jgi:hypothetical protein
MLVLLHARYPASSTKRAIEVFMSPELPKRPDYVKEVGSFVHGSLEGYHNYFLLDVEDKHLAEYVLAQGERSIHLESRVPGLTVEALMGQSVPNAINTAMKQLPK